MLISYKKKFIFIHIYKNAGTSITTALTPFAMNKWQRGLGRVLSKFNISLATAQQYASHIRAFELIDEMGKDVFKSFFSFAIVRNPWDWQVSLYTYALKEPAHHQHDLIKNLGSFDKYIEWRVANEVRFQKDFIYSKDGEQLVDFIGRFERLEEDFQTICSRIGIAASLPKLNVSNEQSYQHYYTDRTMKLVKDAFEPDISIFGYTFS